MGEPLGTQYAALWQETAHLYLTWGEFVELYGTKSTRIELLNRAAPAFFRMVQDRIFEAVLLHIARLTDPSNSLGRKDKSNLTIQNLPELMSDAALKATVSKLCEKAVVSAEFAREWRNRHIAHRDLDLALNGSARPLPAVPLKQVTDSLNSFETVLNALAKHYLNSTTSFSMAARYNGALDLLYLIDDGLKVQGERRERLRSGKPAEGDFTIRDL